MATGTVTRQVCGAASSQCRCCAEAGGSSSTEKNQGTENQGTVFILRVVIPRPSSLSDHLHARLYPSVWAGLWPPPRSPRSPPAPASPLVSPESPRDVPQAPTPALPSAFCISLRDPGKGQLLPTSFSPLPPAPRSRPAPRTPTAPRGRGSPLPAPQPACPRQMEQHDLLPSSPCTRGCCPPLPPGPPAWGGCPSPPAPQQAALGTPLGPSPPGTVLCHGAAACTGGFLGSCHRPPARDGDGGLTAPIVTGTGVSRPGSLQSFVNAELTLT